MTGKKKKRSNHQTKLNFVLDAARGKKKEVEVGNTTKIRIIQVENSLITKCVYVFLQRMRLQKKYILKCCGTAERKIGEKKKFSRKPTTLYLSSIPGPTPWNGTPTKNFRLGIFNFPPTF